LTVAAKEIDPNNKWGNAGSVAKSLKLSTSLILVPTGKFIKTKDKISELCQQHKIDTNNL
jgi:hypothetical protein